MRIGGFKVRRSYAPARIICDIISLGALGFIVFLTVSFIEQCPTTGPQPHLRAWIFPVIGALLFGVYFFVTLRDHAFKKYGVSEGSAQKVYDWFAFAASLVKLVALMIDFEALMIFQEVFSGRGAGINIPIILYILTIVIIIRLSVHRIRSITEKKTENSSGAIRVKAVSAEKTEDKKEKK